jgi:hypothetical protein
LAFWQDDEFDEDPVDEDEGSEPTYPCPGCGEAVYEEADACPYCGEYLSFDNPPGPGQPWWIWLGAMLGLIAILWGTGLLVYVVWFA